MDHVLGSGVLIRGMIFEPPALLHVKARIWGAMSSIQYLSRLIWWTELPDDGSLGLASWHQYPPTQHQPTAQAA
jgi:hypothetical protein